MPETQALRPAQDDTQALAWAARSRAMERFRFTVTRPVAVLMVFCAVIVFGAFSIRLLPLNLMPDISYPRLTVRTEYPGAAPAEVENNVSRPMEEILGVVTGLTRISSVSRGGYSDVVLEFAWDTDMDEANQDVLEKLDAIKPALPTEVKQPLILRYDPTLDPVLTLSLSGDGEAFEGIGGLKYLRRIADRDVRRLLEPIEGVAAVKVKGGLEEEIEVRLLEEQLRRTNIAVDTVIRRLQAENINLAGGSMRDGRTRYLVRTVNEFRDLEDIRGLVIVSREGRDVKLRDIATVESGFKDRDVITRVDGREAVEIEVYKEADANIVDMAGRVTDAAVQTVRPRLQREYGADIDLLTDRSLFIESSISEVRDTAISGGLLAIVILFLFLRDVKSTAIVAVSIPISVLITFAPLNMAGVSLNIMSLGGLALGIGMLVDNSIVVLESIHRCKEEGDDYVTATVRGTSEVGSAVVSSTLTTVAVFFPMVFVEGIAGQMFGDLGLTVVFSLLASLAVALFLIPMLASRSWIGGGGLGDGPAPQVRLWRALLRMMARWASFSELAAAWRGRSWWWLTLLPVLYYALRFALHLVFELLGKLFSTAFILFMALLVTAVGAAGWLVGKVIRPVLWLFDALMRVLEAGYPRLIRWSLRNRVVVYGLVLAAGGATLWAAPRLDNELIPELHQGEFTVELSLPVGTPLPVTQETMLPVEQSLLAGVPGLRDVKASILPGSPEVQIVYNRDALARQNLDIRAVAELVRNKVQGFEATKYNRKDRKIPVRVRLKDIDTATVEELRDLVVNPGAARPVPLSAVADLTLGRGPNEIRRIGQQRVGLVTANLEGAGLGGVGPRIDAALARLDLPAGVTLAVTGQSAEWETSSRSLYLALGLSIFLVYVIMASQFESLIYPLIILVTIPLAAVGVVWALLLLGVPVSVLVFLGGILLAGIVVNNAIVLVDYTGQLKLRGMGTEEALALAGQVRLRPILMTTLTTVLGLIPMALGLGDGAELRTPMAITVIAGLGFSTLLTLVVIPTIYAGVDRVLGGAVAEPRELVLAREVAAVTPAQVAPEVESPAGGEDGRG
jgi:multidrug efflux pump subunit AcrB